MVGHTPLRFPTLRFPTRHRRSQRGRSLRFARTPQDAQRRPTPRHHPRSEFIRPHTFWPRAKSLARAAADAAHIAIAAIHRMDFLVTWNCVHIANATNARALALTCRQQGDDCPVILHSRRTHGTIKHAQRPNRRGSSPRPRRAFSQTGLRCQGHINRLKEATEPLLPQSCLVRP